MLTKTLSEAKKKQRASLIKAMNNDIGSIDSAEDSWNPAQISERTKDISYIRRLVDSWNPSQLNEALKMLDLPVIDTWNPAQIEEQRRNLVFYLAERTLTGNPITLKILGNLTPEITGLKVSLEPIQDLHGQSAPYPAGAGKNKLPFDLAQIKANNTSGTWSGNVYSYNGATFTINDDGSVDVSDVPTSNYVVFVYSDFAGIDGEFKFNGCPTGGASSSNYKMDMLYNLNTGETIAADVGQGSGVFELTSSRNYRARIIIYNSKPIGTVTFKPMVRISTVTDATFAPYSNICPISGRTEASITRTAGEDVETRTHQYQQEIIGGVDDFVNGGATSTYGIVDLGTLNWISEDSEVSGCARVNTAQILPLGIKWSSIPMCSSYKGVLPKAYNAFNYGEIGLSNAESSPLLRCRSEAFIGKTNNEIIAMMSGVQLCYELATPTTIETSAEEITLLKGTNVLSTDGDSIELKYKQNF